MFSVYIIQKKKTKIQIEQLNFDWILNEITFDSNYITLGPSYHLRKYKVLVLDTFIKKNKQIKKTVNKALVTKPKILVWGLEYQVRRC